jgi:hypothetical protein
MDPMNNYGFHPVSNLSFNWCNNRSYILTNTSISSWYQLIMRRALADELSLRINTSSIETGLRALTLINVCAVA